MSFRTLLKKEKGQMKEEGKWGIKWKLKQIEIEIKN